MTGLTIYELIEGRRSVRKYLRKEVPKGVLRRVLNAARWAPSAHNAQPWRFVLIKDSAVKKELAEAMARKWDEDLRNDGVPLSERQQLIEASIKTFTGSPNLIVTCLTMEDMDKYPDERRRNAEYIMAVQSVAAAIQNVLLAAHAEGLGTCWFCAPLFCKEAVVDVLGLPDGIEPQALITVGYPAERPKVPQRKPLKDVLRLNRW